MNKTLIVYFLFIILILFLILFIWINIYFFVSLFSVSKSAPYVSSFNKELKVMKLLKLKKGKKILDLGCGDGKALRFFKKNFDLVGEGYDINYFAIKFGKILNYLFNIQVKLIRKDFFNADLKKYDYIYVYLFPNQLEYMEDWVFDNIKKDAVVISNSFQFKKHKPFDVIKNTKGRERIFLYKI